MSNLDSIMSDYEKKLADLRDERDHCAADTESWHGIAGRTEKERDALKKPVD